MANGRWYSPTTSGKWQLSSKPRPPIDPSLAPLCSDTWPPAVASAGLEVGNVKVCVHAFWLARGTKRRQWHSGKYKWPLPSPSSSCKGWWGSHRGVKWSLPFPPLSALVETAGCSVYSQIHCCKHEMLARASKLSAVWLRFPELDSLHPNLVALITIKSDWLRVAFTS